MPRAQADRVYSEAHNDLYQFSFDSRRWFPCSLRRPRGAAAVAAPPPPAETSADADPAAASSGSEQTTDGGADGRSAIAAHAAAPEAAAAGTVRFRGQKFDTHLVAM